MLNISSWNQSDASVEKNAVLSHDNCSECGKNILFDENRGLIVCEKCGLVQSEKHIDQGPEWRAFDSDQRKKRTRTGAPMTLMIHDKGLSTMIDWKNKDIFGKEI